MNHRQIIDCRSVRIVDFIIAHDLEFSLFEPLYKLKYGEDANKETVDRALTYFETGE